MPATSAGERHVERGGGPGAELASEVGTVRLELRVDGCAGPETDHQLFRGGCVYQVELDVLVAAAFTGASVGLAQEIDRGALCLVRTRGRLGRGNRWWFLPLSHQSHENDQAGNAHRLPILALVSPRRRTTC